MVAMENPTCIARLVQFKAVAVAIQPRFHHFQHLNKVTVQIGQRCAVGHQCKMAGVSKWFPTTFAQERNSTDNNIGVEENPQLHSLG